MIDGLKLLLRLNICTNAHCYRHLRHHCPYCWACDVDRHVCDRKPVPQAGGRRPRSNGNEDGDLDYGS